MRERNGSRELPTARASRQRARDYVSSRQLPDFHCSMEGQVPGNFSVERPWQGSSPWGSVLRMICVTIALSYNRAVNLFLNASVGLPAALGFADSDSELRLEAKRGMRVSVLEVNHDEGACSKNFKPSSAQARCARRPSLHTGSGPGPAAVLHHHCRRPPLPVAPWPGPTGVWVHETCALRRCRTGRRQGRGLWTARSESVTTKAPASAH